MDLFADLPPPLPNRGKLHYEHMHAVTYSPYTFELYITVYDSCSLSFPQRPEIRKQTFHVAWHEAMMTLRSVVRKKTVICSSANSLWPKSVIRIQTWQKAMFCGQNGCAGDWGLI